MQSKTETVIRSEKVLDRGNLYCYTLTESDSANGTMLYSLRISLRMKNGEFSENTARDIFTEKSAAMHFFDKMLKNLATPLNLPYVIEDELLD